MKVLLAMLFVLAGINHFANATNYVAIVPHWIPFPLAAVYVSGVFEVVLGFMLLVSRLQRLAAWGLIMLLIAVFPANIQMALHAERYPDFPAVLLWLRLPLQGLLIWWVSIYTRRRVDTRVKGATFP
ncbi:MAG TPA: DoxX family protein [Thermoanaerobaculia bacterium]|nr:DoxX family protein [Thermoanaerobaculia bacterium]